MAGKPTGNPTGRPTLYTDELAKRICDLHSEGITLPNIADMDGIPNRATIYQWERDVPGFSDKLDIARANFAQARLDELANMALERRNDELRDNYGRRDPVAVKRDELAIGLFKWLAEKRLPKKYGNKVQTELTGSDGAPLIPIINVKIKSD